MKTWKAALEVVKYLGGTPTMELLRATTKAPTVPLCGYSDSSWADDPDDRTSRADTMAAVGADPSNGIEQARASAVFVWQNTWPSFLHQSVVWASRPSNSVTN